MVNFQKLEMGSLLHRLRFFKVYLGVERTFNRVWHKLKVISVKLVNIKNLPISLHNLLIKL